MAAVQMNTRIDDDLKKAGDEVIARLGLNPSQVVRAVWESIVAQGELPLEVSHRIQQRRFDADASMHARGPCNVAEAGSRLVPEFYRTWGVPAPQPTDYDFDSLYEQAAHEQLAEWGLS